MYPVALGNTAENLQSAAEGEHEEWTDLYPTFGKIAEEEGFPKVAKTFFNITQVEEKHEARYLEAHSTRSVERGRFLLEGYEKFGDQVTHPLPLPNAVELAINN